MSKELAENPIKLSQPAGAALAFLGVKGCIPLWHGVQGCTAFGKILFIQHFREPVPFQTTALTQTSVVMGSDSNGEEAIDILKEKAELIGFFTTGVVEASGADTKALLKRYKEKNKEAKIVGVSTPDFTGSLETGHAKAVRAMLKELVGPKSKRDPLKVAILAGPYLTPGEVNELRNMAEAFGLKPVILPDIGDSLYGYLDETRFSRATRGGVSLEEIERLSDADFLVSVGSSAKRNGEWFGAEHEVPSFHFDELSTIEEVDRFIRLLAGRSGRDVPERFKRERRHMLDTLLDTQFYFHNKRFALAGDPEFLNRWIPAIKDMSGEPLPLSAVRHEEYKAGDIHTLEEMMDETPCQLVIGNTHLAELAERKGLASLRCGIPVSDRMGEPQSVRIGYLGGANLLRDCANAIMEHTKSEEAYVSTLQRTLR